MIVPAALFGALGSALTVTAGEPVGMTFDLAAHGKIITDKFSDINVWQIDQPWTEQPLGRPRDYFAANFLFVRRIHLMAATGGNEQRDLFRNPLDRTNLTDYDFDRLVRACENIVANGLKPMIKTGWVPLKLSANPHVGEEFGTNLRPPRTTTLTTLTSGP